MSNFNERLNECFDLEETILREMTTIPVGELNRILNQTEIKRSIMVSDKGTIGAEWDKFFQASKNKDKAQAKRSLAKLIMGYGIILQFLGQPKNKRGQFLRKFLRSTQGEPSKK
jgi:hypothetical protein